jgi:hypothetical protein
MHLLGIMKQIDTRIIVIADRGFPNIKTGMKKATVSSSSPYQSIQV